MVATLPASLQTNQKSIFLGSGDLFLPSPRCFSLRLCFGFAAAFSCGCEDLAEEFEKIFIMMFKSTIQTKYTNKCIGHTANTNWQWSLKSHNSVTHMLDVSRKIHAEDNNSTHKIKSNYIRQKYCHVIFEMARV